VSLPLDIQKSEYNWRKTVSGRFGAGTLATNATTGFFYVPTCAGTPTGTPANTPTGFVPLVVDSTNNKLYFYSGGAWRDAGP
jgi:hypothetical protein